MYLKTNIEFLAVSKNYLILSGLIIMIYYAGKYFLHKIVRNKKQRKLQEIVCLEVREGEAQIIEVKNKSSKGEPFWIKRENEFSTIKDTGYFTKGDNFYFSKS